MDYGSAGSTPHETIETLALSNGQQITVAWPLTLNSEDYNSFAEWIPGVQNKMQQAAGGDNDVGHRGRTESTLRETAGVGT